MRINRKLKNTENQQKILGTKIICRRNLFCTKSLLQNIKIGTERPESVHPPHHQHHQSATPGVSMPLVSEVTEQRLCLTSYKILQIKNSSKQSSGFLNQKHHDIVIKFVPFL